MQDGVTHYLDGHQFDQLLGDHQDGRGAALKASTANIAVTPFIGVVPASSGLGVGDRTLAVCLLVRGSLDPGLPQQECDHYLGRLR
jgi:hypothetical protein